LSYPFPQISHFAVCHPLKRDFRCQWDLELFPSNEMKNRTLKELEEIAMRLTSSSFQQGGEIPDHYSSDGEDASPELSWQDGPSENKSFALIVHDPDAPRPGGFTHWVVYNIPPDTGHIAENVPDTGRVTGLGMQGKNDRGRVGYVGPAPPSGTHRYFFRLYAVREPLQLPKRPSADDVHRAVTGREQASGTLVGLYQR